MRESDIWAFGATLYQLMCGEMPYGEDGGLHQTQDAPTPHFPDFIPDDIQRLTLACLAFDPAKRPTAETIRRAAEIQQFPIRKKSAMPAILTGAVLATIVLLVSMFFLKSKPAVIQPDVPTEQVYAEALYRMDHWHDADSLRLGLQQMDSLAKFSYVPAIYQLAFTYGWYSDPISLERKKLLGIPIYEEGDNKFFPTDDAITTRAISHFLNITQIDDFAHNDLTIEACHRLAAYYWNYESDAKKAIKYLTLGREHAIIVGNDSIRQNFDKLLEIVK